MIWFNFFGLFVFIFSLCNKHFFCCFYCSPFGTVLCFSVQYYVSSFIVLLCYFLFPFFNLMFLLSFTTSCKTNFLSSTQQSSESDTGNERNEPVTLTLPRLKGLYLDFFLRLNNNITHNKSGVYQFYDLCVGCMFWIKLWSLIASFSVCVWGGVWTCYTYLCGHIFW